MVLALLLSSAPFGLASPLTAPADDVADLPERVVNGISEGEEPENGNSHVEDRWWDVFGRDFFAAALGSLVGVAAGIPAGLWLDRFRRRRDRRLEADQGLRAVRIEIEQNRQLVEEALGENDGGKITEEVVPLAVSNATLALSSVCDREVALWFRKTSTFFRFLTCSRKWRSASGWMNIRLVGQPNGYGGGAE